MNGPRSHPDRRAETLAVRERADGEYLLPGAGSADARVGLKLLAARARTALATRGTDAARARLSELDSPDLWAGTVQDAVARGVAVALEEAISLCDPSCEPERALPELETLTPKELRRKREVVVTSGGARVRFSRKGGVTLIDRARDVVTNDVIRFEDRTDVGDLDGFAPREEERPRLFSPAFLKITGVATSPETTRLELAGRLGRRPTGFPCELTFVGHSDEPGVRMRVRIRNEQRDHRLRIRFLGLRDAIHHAGTPGWELVHARGKTFRAATIVRANDTLRVDGEIISVPDAQCVGWIEHEFLLGGVWGKELTETQGWQRAPDSAD